MSFNNTMALVSYVLRRYLASLPDEWLAWFEPIVKSYTGPETNPALVDTIASVRNSSPTDRRRALLANRDSSMGLGLREYAVPFLVAHMADLSIFPISFQAAILRVKGHLDVFNQQVVFLQKQFDRTFDSSLSEENRQAVRANIDNGYQELAEKADQIANGISPLSGRQRPTDFKAVLARGSDGDRARPD